MDKVTLGHENAGIVVALGSRVEGFKVGDRVGCLGCSYACCACLYHTCQRCMFQD